MKSDTPFLRYVSRNIGVITYLLYITFCFVCFYILTASRVGIVIGAISDFGVYEETRLIFIIMCIVTGSGILILFNQVLKELSLEHNLPLNILAIIVCMSFIGLSLIPSHYSSLAHDFLAITSIGGFGALLFFIAFVKKFKGKYMLFTLTISMIESVFAVFTFFYWAKVIGGYFIPELIILGLIGAWVVVSEIFLGERAHRKSLMS